MFATVRIDTPLESIEPFKELAAKSGRVVLSGLGGEVPPLAYEFLAVPERAVIDTGSKKVVYVEREPGMFEGVEVELGPRQGELLSGHQGTQGRRQGGRGGRFPDRRGNAAQPGRRRDLLRRQRRPAVQQGRPDVPIGPQSAPEPIRPRPIKSKPDSPVAPQPEPRRDGRFARCRRPQKHRTAARGRPAIGSAQRICPVTGRCPGLDGRAGEDHPPRPDVFLCCQGCMGKAKRNPDEMLKILAEAAQAGRSDNPRVGWVERSELANVEPNYGGCRYHLR